MNKKDFSLGILQKDKEYFSKQKYKESRIKQKLQNERKLKIDYCN